MSSAKDVKHVCGKLSTALSHMQAVVEKVKKTKERTAFFSALIQDMRNMVSRRAQELTDTEDSDLEVWECIDKREAENATIKACSKVWEANLERGREWKEMGGNTQTCRGSQLR